LCGNVWRQANDEDDDDDDDDDDDNNNNNNNNNVRCMIIPAILGATGIVTKGLRKHLKAVPTDHSTDSLQQLYLEHHT
jgi:hypothetical protein